jgi:hypothetical protein
VLVRRVARWWDSAYARVRLACCTQAVEFGKLGIIVATVRASDQALITRVSEILSGRHAGVIGSARSGMTGERTAIRIRGNASMSHARIELLKGATAARPYGSEAPNGVIQIFTKRVPTPTCGEVAILEVWACVGSALLVVG